MFLLNHAAPQNASGRIKEIYDLFPPAMGPPLPLQLISASPGFMLSQFEIMKYFTGHERLSFHLLAAIRYMAADACDYDYCIAFNRNLLIASGASEIEVSAILKDPDNAPLEEREKALLKFVSKAIRTPERVGREDIEALHALGWSDPDIIDAVAHGAFMRGHATLMQAFMENKNPWTQ